MPKLTIYVARAMDARSLNEIALDDERYSHLLNSIGCIFANPFRQAVFGPVQEGLAIAERDLALLRTSDLMLADLSIPDYQYVGCIFEIVHAINHNIPVVLVVGKSELFKRAFFQAYCDFITQDADDAVEYIRRAYTPEGIRQQMAEMKAYYSQIAAVYHNQSVRTHRRSPEEVGNFLEERQQLKGVISEYGSGRVCQIGIGTGDWTQTICERAQSVLAIEQSGEMLDQARINLASYDNIRFLQADILEGELPGGVFDCVVVYFLVSLFPPPTQDRFFERVSRLLKPGGILIVADTKKPGDLRAIGMGRRQLQERRSNEKTYVLYKEHFVGDSLAKLLTRKGYEPVKASPQSIWFSWVVSRQNG